MRKEKIMAFGYRPISQKTNLQVHIETVTGIVQIIKFVDEQSKAGRTSFGMDEVFRAGAEGKSEDAQDFVLEFIKDSDIPKEAENKILAGDYAYIWEITNDYLSRFGFPPVEPVPIQIP